MIVYYHRVLLQSIVAIIFVIEAVNARGRRYSNNSAGVGGCRAGKGSISRGRDRILGPAAAMHHPVRNPVTQARPPTPPLTYVQTRKRSRALSRPLDTHVPDKYGLLQQIYGPR